MSCALCPLHLTARTIQVRHRGPLTAEVLLLGEAPGENEELYPDGGSPFVGKAGRVLAAALERAGYRIPLNSSGQLEWDRSSFCIDNVVRCRPPKNEEPEAEFVKACSVHTEALIRQMPNLRVIVSLGNTPLAYLTGRKGILARMGVPITVEVPDYGGRDGEVDGAVHGDGAGAGDGPGERADAGRSAGEPRGRDQDGGGGPATSAGGGFVRVGEGGSRGGLRPITLYPLIHPAALLRPGGRVHAQTFEAHMKGLPALLAPRENPTVRLVRSPGGLDGWPVFRPGEVVAFDLETTHFNPRLGGILDVSFRQAGNSDPPVSVAVQDPQTLAKLRAFYLSDVPKAVFYSAMEMGWGWHHLGAECRNVVADPYLMALRLDEDPAPGTKTLEHLSAKHFPEKYAGYKFKTQEALDRGEADLLDPVDLMTRNAVDAAATLDLVPVYEALLGPRQVAFHQEYDLPIMNAVAKMTHQGLAVDVKRLRTLRAECVDRMTAALKQVEAVNGSPINANSPKQLREMLARLMVDTHKQTDGGDMSTDEDALLGVAHPVAEPIIAYRKADKIRGTYCAAIEDAIEKGAVYPEWRWPGTVTRRLSCSNPNFQNLPVRTPLGKQVRGAIVSRWAGGRLWNCDLSQIELRVLASLSQDVNMIRLFREGGDLHMETSIRAFGLALAKEKRTYAKQVNFGRVYGAEAPTVQKTIRKDAGVLLPIEEVEALLRGFDEAYPQAAAYMNRTREEAMRGRDIESPIGGYIYHVGGRLATCRGKWERMEVGRSAANSPVQTAGAILTSVALARISSLITGGDCAIIGQVHDEVLGDAKDEGTAREAAELAKKVMIAVCAEQTWFLVPGAAECAVAENWAALK